jgi:hypothetical protein
MQRKLPIEFVEVVAKGHEGSNGFRPPRQAHTIHENFCRNAAGIDRAKGLIDTARALVWAPANKII